VKLNPKTEVEYRAKMARRHLEDAERALQIGDYRGTVDSAQRSAENAAKAVIAIYRIPSWSHDPSAELLDVTSTLPKAARERALNLARLAHELAPEHGRATYGEPLRELTPWDLYGKSEAESAVEKAEKAVDLMNQILPKPNES